MCPEPALSSPGNEPPPSVYITTPDSAIRRSTKQHIIDQQGSTQAWQKGMHSVKRKAAEVRGALLHTPHLYVCVFMNWFEKLPLSYVRKCINLFEFIHSFVHSVIM